MDKINDMIAAAAVAVWFGGALFSYSHAERGKAAVMTAFGIYFLLRSLHRFVR